MYRPHPPGWSQETEDLQRALEDWRTSVCIRNFCAGDAFCALTETERRTLTQRLFVDGLPGPCTEGLRSIREKLMWIR